MLCFSSCWCRLAEFEGLKSELERLLVKNRGLTRLESPEAAAISTNSPGSSQEGSRRDSHAGTASSCSDSLQQSPHSSLGSRDSSRSFSGVLLGAADRQASDNTYPISAAERASQQLNHDVDLLLKQVDSVMAAPVLQLPAWFTRQSASPSCTVTELQTADRLRDDLSPAPPARRQHRVVSPKLKASSLSTPHTHGQSTAANTPSSATNQPAAQSGAQPSSSGMSPAAAVTSARPNSAQHTLSSASVSSSPAQPQVPDEQPDNLAILHVACTISPTGSQDTCTTIRSTPAEHTNIVDSPLSPNKWHTNHLADHASSHLCESSSSDDSQAASASQSVCDECSHHQRAHVTAAAAEHSVTRHRQTLMPSQGSGLIKAARHSHVSESDNGSGDEQTENVAPGWHRQPLKHAKPISSMPGSLAAQPPISQATAEETGNVAGLGLVEGYMRGANAKLQLPAAVRMGSRKTALSVRTPLRSITEVHLNVAPP